MTVFLEPLKVNACNESPVGRYRKETFSNLTMKHFSCGTLGKIKVLKYTLCGILYLGDQELFEFSLYSPHLEELSPGPQ